MMLRLVYLTTIYLSCMADPKAPRIYNVLISSKKNLSPSQALPVYQPVIKTTSLTYFPPLTIYSTLGHPYRVIPQFTYPEYGNLQANTENQKLNEFQPTELKNLIKPHENPELSTSQDEIRTDDQGKEPLPHEQFIPFYSPLLPNYTPQLSKQPLSHSQGPLNYENIDEVPKQTNLETQPKKFGIPRAEHFPALAHETDPKHAIANLRHKSDIPDVPPPPLPVRMKS